MNNDGGAEMAQVEARAMERLVRLIHARHPDVPVEDIAERSCAEHRRYAGAPIRDFVPLLVERALLAELRTGRWEGVSRRT